MQDQKPIENQCGNPRHPRGAWHEAEPYSLKWINQIKRWWRKRKYGCACPPNARIEKDIRKNKNER